jgi:hypothetical protein
MALKMKMMMFWVVTSCGLVGRYPEDGDGMFLRNAGIYLQAHTASQPKRTSSDCVVLL